MCLFEHYGIEPMYLEDDTGYYRLRTGKRSREEGLAARLAHRTKSLQSARMNLKPKNLTEWLSVYDWDGFMPAHDLHGLFTLHTGIQMSPRKFGIELRRQDGITPHRRNRCRGYIRRTETEAHVREGERVNAERRRMPDQVIVLSSREPEPKPRMNRQAIIARIRELEGELSALNEAERGWEESEEFKEAS